MGGKLQQECGERNIRRNKKNEINKKNGQAGIGVKLFSDFRSEFA